MIIGCPKEIKSDENRVSLIPSSVDALSKLGVKILIEKGAGIGSHIPDEHYLEAGAEIVSSCAELWERSEIICKVKEPLPEEFKFFRRGQTIYTFLHLAAEPELTNALIEKKVSGIAYETIEEHGHLPLLKPMSEVAGRMAVQVGARCLENRVGGKGILLGGVPGVRKARVMILGGGIVGKNAAKIALGMGAQVTVFDINADRLEEFDDIFLGQVQTMFSNPHTINSQLNKADLVIGAVLLPGARAPRLITKDMIKEMDPGSAVVDVAVDQGGCIETVRRTTHENPTYIVDDVVHYGVANMPGAVAATSTYALSHATFPYLKYMIKRGIPKALRKNRALLKGLNTYDGHITYKRVAEAFNFEYIDPLELI